MLPRGPLVCLCVASGIVTAIAVITAWFGQKDLMAQIAVGAFVVCVLSALAIPLAPRAPGVAATQMARLLTYLLALWAINGLLAAIFFGSLWGEALVILAWSMLWVGLQGALIAVPALFRRRRVDTARTVAQGIAIWGAICIVVVAQLLGLVLAVFPPHGAAWTGIGQLWLNMVCSYAFMGTLVASLAAIVPESNPAGTGGRAMAFHPFVRFCRISMLVLTGAATALVVVPGLWQVFEPSMDTIGAPMIEMWAAYALTLAALPVGFAAWNLIGVVPMGRLSSILRAVSAVFALLCLACFGNALMPRPDVLSDSGTWWVFGAVSMIVALVHGFAAFAIGWLRADTVSRSFAIDSITWRCPRCSSWFAIVPGTDTRCGGCGLAVQVMLRDDRCPHCRYDLHALGDGPATCPECGRERQVTVALAGTRLAATSPGVQQDSQVGSVHAVVTGEVRV